MLFLLFLFVGILPKFEGLPSDTVVTTFGRHAPVSKLLAAYRNDPEQWDLMVNELRNVVISLNTFNKRYQRLFEDFLLRFVSADSKPYVASISNSFSQFVKGFGELSRLVNGTSSSLDVISMTLIEALGDFHSFALQSTRFFHHVSGKLNVSLSQFVAPLMTISDNLGLIGNNTWALEGLFRVLERARVDGNSFFVKILEFLGSESPIRLSLEGVVRALEALGRRESEIHIALRDLIGINSPVGRWFNNNIWVFESLAKILEGVRIEGGNFNEIFNNTFGEGSSFARWFIHDNDRIREIVHSIIHSLEHYETPSYGRHRRGVFSWISGLFTPITSTMHEVVDRVENALPNLGEKILDWLKRLFDRVAEWWIEMLDKVEDYIEAFLVKWFKLFWKMMFGLLRHIVSLISTFPAWLFDLSLVCLCFYLVSKKFLFSLIIAILSVFLKILTNLIFDLSNEGYFDFSSFGN